MLGVDIEFYYDFVASSEGGDNSGTDSSGDKSIVIVVVMAT